MSNRARAWLAATGLVLLGFALGVFGDHLWLASRVHASVPEYPREESIVAMLDALDPTNEQRDAINEVIDRFHGKVEQQLAAVHPMLLATMDSARREIEAMLRPEQLVVFRDWIRSEHGRIHPGWRSGIEH